MNHLEQLTENLNLILDSKSSIKQSIENKGILLDNISFSQYGTLIDENLIHVDDATIDGIELRIEDILDSDSRISINENWKRTNINSFEPSTYNSYGNSLLEISISGIKLISIKILLSDKELYDSIAISKLNKPIYGVDLEYEALLTNNGEAEVTYFIEDTSSISKISVGATLGTSVSKAKFLATITNIKFDSYDVIEKLQLISDIKDDIKTAIFEKGVPLLNSKFEDYPKKISEIETSSSSGAFISYDLMINQAKNLLLQTLEEHESEGFKRGTIFIYKITEDMKGFARTGGNFTSNYKIIFSDGFILQNDGNWTYEFTNRNSDFAYFGSNGDIYKYGIVMLKETATQISSFHYLSEVFKILIKGDSGEFISATCPTIIISSGTFPYFGYMDLASLEYIELINGITNPNTVSGIGYRGSCLHTIKGLDFTNYTGNFFYDFLTHAIDIKNISGNQNINNNNTIITVNSLITLLDALVDTNGTTRTFNCGGYSSNINKLKTSSEGLAAIARATEKGWTVS